MVITNAHSPKRLCVSVSLCVSILLGTGSLTASAQPRMTMSLNLGWEFSRDSLFSKTERVDVPHDFQIGQPWIAPAADEQADTSDAAANIRSRLSARGFKEMGAGWYRRRFTPADLYFEHHPLLITTRDNRYVTVAADVTNRTKDRLTTLRLRLTDPLGRTVAEQTTTQKRNSPAMVILRAGTTPSKITFKTSSDTYKTITTNLETKQ